MGWHALCLLRLLGVRDEAYSDLRRRMRQVSRLGVGVCVNLALHTLRLLLTHQKIEIRDRFQILLRLLLCENRVSGACANDSQLFSTHYREQRTKRRTFLYRLMVAPAAVTASGAGVMRRNICVVSRALMGG